MNHDHLAASMQLGVIIKANIALLSNTADSTGLLNQPGNTGFDPISDAITSVETNGGTVILHRHGFAFLGPAM